MLVRNVFTSFLSLFALAVHVSSVTMVILRILFIHVHTDIHEWDMRNATKQKNRKISHWCYWLQYTMCALREHLQHLGGTKCVSLIPEGLVTELAGVRQTCASFLLTTGGHAKVTAAIGHL